MPCSNIFQQSPSVANSNDDHADMQDDGRVVAHQRTAIYLEPKDVQYFEARGRAVGIYDNTLTMQRVPAPEGANVCVETFKGVTQCI